MSYDQLGKILLQGAIPFCYVSSGSIGANGALSGITALPQAYSDCFCYFPAGAVYAGSAAGWYYTQMSTTQLGTVFNNVYQGGQPVIPASPTPIVAAGPGSYTQTTGVNIVSLSALLQGNTLGNNGEIQFDRIHVQTNNANVKTAPWQLNGLTVGGACTLTSSAGVAQMSRMRNRGKPNSQVGAQSTAGDVNVSFAGNAVAAIDTTQNQLITSTINSATATDSIVLESYSLKVFPN